MLLMLSIAVSARAQGAHGAPPRPKLKSAADSNEWTEYYSAGLKKLKWNPEEAAAYFHWSGLLQPADPNPLYAEWIARWMMNKDRLAEYLQRSEFLLRDPKTQQVDTLFYEALLRNPFFLQSLERLWYRGVEFSRDDPYTRGWTEYTEGHSDRAVREFARAMEVEPKAWYIHGDRARAFFMLHQYDSTVAELMAVREFHHRNEKKHITYLYESSEILEYEIGIALQTAGRYEQAKEAFGRALAENLAFAPAHAALGKLAFFDADTTHALTEYDQAVQLNPSDPVVELDYAKVLTQSNHYDDAVVHYRKAIELDPYYSVPYLYLAGVLEAQGKSVPAIDAFTQFIARAPRILQPQVEDARMHIAKLNESLTKPGDK
jgi:tetratricopeptide (TPR) repeat protein